MKKIRPVQRQAQAEYGHGKLTREEALNFLQEHYVVSQIQDDMVTLMDIQKYSNCARSRARRIVDKAVLDGVLAPGQRVFNGEGKIVVAYRTLSAPNGKLPKKA